MSLSGSRLCPGPDVLPIGIHHNYSAQCEPVNTGNNNNFELSQACILIKVFNHDVESV